MTASHSNTPKATNTISSSSIAGDRDDAARHPRPVPWRWVRQRLSPSAGPQLNQTEYEWIARDAWTDALPTDGCSGCHSLNGTRLTGPSWKGLAGSHVTLSNGKTITATNAYLTRHIVEPNAMTVQGYPGEVMAEAIETLGLKNKPNEVQALVAFIDSLK